MSKNAHWTILVAIMLINIFGAYAFVLAGLVTTGLISGLFDAVAVAAILGAFTAGYLSENYV